MLTALIVLKHAGYFKTARLLFAHCGNCASKQTDDTNQLNIHFMYRQLRSDFHVILHTVVNSVVVCSKKGSNPLICLKHPTETAKLTTKRQRP